MNHKTECSTGTSQHTSCNDIGWMMPVIHNSRNPDKCSPSPGKHSGKEHVHLVPMIIIIIRIAVAVCFSFLDNTLLHHPQCQDRHGAKTQRRVSRREGQLRFDNFGKRSRGALSCFRRKGTEVIIVGPRPSHPEFEQLGCQFRQAHGGEECIQNGTGVSTTRKLDKNHKNQG